MDNDEVKALPELKKATKTAERYVPLQAREEDKMSDQGIRDKEIGIFVITQLYQ